MEQQLKECLNAQSKSYVIQERQNPCDVDQGQKLDEIQRFYDIFRKVLRLPVNFGKEELDDPVVKQHCQQGQEDTQRCDVGEPDRDEEDPDDILIIVGVRYLISLPKPVNVRLGEGVWVGVHFFDSVPPQHLYPHHGVK